MFGTSTDYHELNAGAHRNSPKNLSAPALTWHLAFWISKPALPYNLGQIVDVRKKLDAFLLALCSALNDDNKLIDNNKVIKDVRLHPRVPNKSGQPYFLLFNTVANASFRPVDSPTSLKMMTERQ